MTKPSNRNDITGDRIITGVPSDAYRNNFDRIFNKPEVCPRCNGEGYDPDPEPVCCGNGNIHGCCGDPVPEWGPCHDCGGSGELPKE